MNFASWPSYNGLEMSDLQSPGFDAADFAAQRLKLAAAYDNMRAKLEQRAFAMSENVRTAFAGLDVEPRWFKHFTHTHHTIPHYALCIVHCTQDLHSVHCALYMLTMYYSTSLK